MPLKRDGEKRKKTKNNNPSWEKSPHTDKFLLKKTARKGNWRPRSFLHKRHHKNGETGGKPHISLQVGHQGKKERKVNKKNG